MYAIHNVCNTQCIQYTAMHNVCNTQCIQYTMYTMHNAIHSNAQCIQCTIYTMHNVNSMLRKVKDDRLDS